MGSESGLGEAFVPIRATLDKLDSDLDNARQKVDGAMQKIGKGAVSALSIVLVAITTAFIAIGGAAFQAAQTVDKAYDTIQASTGATGERMDELKESFRDVFSSVPADAEVVTDVISTLGARTEMTQETITNLGTSLVQLADLTGGDAKTQTELYTRVLGDWSVSNEDAAKTLDMVYAASQATGAGVDTLMQQVVQFGSPLRLMGFTLEESIGLFGKWEKEGVNAELVMGSLRIAAGKFAAEGKPLRESLLSTFDSIKNNTDASAALADAMDVFGARAGPDMAAAIREGRFELGDLLETMGDSQGVINDTAWATADFGEKLTILKNKATLALEPIGTAMMGVAGTVMDVAIPAFEKLQPAIEKISTIVTTVIGLLVQFATTIGTSTDPLASLKELIYDIGMAFGLNALEAFNLADQIMNVVAQVQLAIAKIQEFLAPIVTFISENVKASDVLIALGVAIASVVIPAIASVIAAAAPLIAIFVAVVAIVALVRQAWEENWGGIQEKTQAAWDTIRPLLEQAWTWLQINLPLALETLRAWWVDVAWPAIQNAIAVAWPVIEQIFIALLDWVAKDIERLVDLYTQWTTVWWPNIQKAIQTVWPIIEAVFKALKDWVIGTLIPTLVDLYTQWTTVWWPNIQKAIQTVWTVIEGVFKSLKEWVTGTLIPTVTDLYDEWKVKWEKIQTVLENVWAPIEGVFKEVGRWINDNIMPWVEELHKQWTTVWWPNIQKSIEDMWKIVQPIWEKFQKWLDETIPEALEGTQKKFEDVMSGIDEAVDPVKQLWEKFVNAVEDFFDFISSHTFTFKITIPDLPDWATPGSPLPIHTAWKKFAEDSDRIFPMLNAGMLAQAPVYEATNTASTSYQYNIQAATPLANSEDLAREIRLLEMLHK